jgi:hypothetical protein
VCVENGGVSLLRRRETADEFFARDDKANSVLHEPDTFHEVMS